MDGRNHAIEQKKRDRTLLLCRDQYPRHFENFFSNKFNASVAEREFGSAASWPSVPPCLLALDGQLRRALPELLGGAEDGDFVLAYAQITRMCTGNSIDFHVDTPHFGDVIVTVGLAGNAQVELKPSTKLNTKWRPNMPNWLQHTRISEGDVYVLAGESRHRFEHRVFSDLGDAALPEYGPDGGGVARVAATLRYQRRSFCVIETRSLLQRAQPLPLTAAEERARDVPVQAFEPGTIVDVKATINPGRNPFTYPALVLGSVYRRPIGSTSSSTPVLMLKVQCLSDRRTFETATEALDAFDCVLPEAAVRSNEATVRRCREEYPEAELNLKL